MLGILVTVAAGSAAALAVQAAAPVEQVGGMQREQIERIVHEYILAHPEILPEAMERLNAKRTGDLISAKRSAIETPYAGAWEGAADADVTVVEFFDYACGYCRASLPDLAKLVANDPKVKVVYRELPILSAESTEAAKVSLLAAERGRYMPFHKALYATGRVTRDSILTAASSVGIDRKSAEAAIANPAYDREIAANIALAQELRASGTPTFVVGNQILSGAVGYDAIREAVAKARE